MALGPVCRRKAEECGEPLALAVHSAVGLRESELAQAARGTVTVTVRLAGPARQRGAGGVECPPLPVA